MFTLDPKSRRTTAQEPLIRRKPTDGPAHAESAREAPAVVAEALRSGGEPLDAGARAYFEPRFGHDFRGVRVHTDATAAASAHAIQAAAYTVGPHIAFAAGQYSPSTPGGRRLLAHELTHVVQHAEVAAPVVRRSGFKPLVDAVKGFNKFIDDAKKYGLPTKILEKIKFPERSMEVGSGDHYNPVTNKLTLQKETLAAVANMDPDLPYREGTGVQTIYHESTHAILDVLEDDPKFDKFIKAGQAHYKGALTTEGKATSDPERLFQEAAASYVGHRVAHWWSALECLTVASSLSADKRVKWVADCKKDYNSAMAERVFGYSYEGILAQLQDDQMSTTRAISADMKTFMDSELLEGKVPDKFDSVSHFVSLEQELLKSIPATPASP